MPLSEEQELYIYTQAKQFIDIATRMLQLIEYIYRNTEAIKLDVARLERKLEGE